MDKKNDKRLTDNELDKVSGGHPMHEMGAPMKAELPFFLRIGELFEVEEKPSTYHGAAKGSGGGTAEW